MGERSILFQAVGDIALGDHPLCAGFGTHSYCRSRNGGFPFDPVLPIFRRADVLFGNLECTLSERGLRPSDYHSVQMRGHRDYLAGLKGAGFAVVNIANNHSLQHGEEPFLHTVEMLRSNGIGVCGLRAPESGGCRPALIEKQGVKVAFLGYSLRPRQYFTQKPLYAEGHRPIILEDVRQARQRSDAVVVVSMHWGHEFVDRPSAAEMDLAHEIMSAGADLIIGHHPHVLRGVERSGRGYVVYSLGNFVCDMLWDETLRESAIVECRLSREGVSDFRLIPVRISDEYRPITLQGSDASDLQDRLLKLSEQISRTSSARGPQETSTEYERLAEKAHRRARRRSHLYFLRHLHRFPPSILFQQFLTFTRNRLLELRARIP